MNDMNNRTEMFRSLRESNQSLDSRIVTYVRDLIERGELLPGDRLPSERELALQLGVSRPVLREALHTLSALGLVEMRHGRGVFVTAGSMHATAQRLSSALAGEQDNAHVHELFEIRRVLEGAAAEWAAERASTEQLAELQEVLAQERQARTAEPLDVALVNELDGRLHAIIAASAANRMLMHVMVALLDELAHARSQSLLIPGRVERSLHQHEELVAAIAARNPATARARMIEHLDDVEQSIQARVNP